MWPTTDHFQTVFWIAVIPAFLSVALILVAVKEPERPKELGRVRMPLDRDELRRLGMTYWWMVAVAAVFTLARFSEAFLILPTQSTGLPLTLAPGVMAGGFGSRVVSMTTESGPVFSRKGFGNDDVIAAVAPLNENPADGKSRRPLRSRRPQ